MDKVLSPVTQNLKQNSSMINLALLSLLLFFLFPIKHFLSLDVQDKVKAELKNLTNNPYVMAVLSVLLFAIFQTGNLNMLVLTLYLVHHILMH